MRPRDGLGDMAEGLELVVTELEAVFSHEHVVGCAIPIPD
jgi:hypothetical protein